MDTNPLAKIPLPHGISRPPSNTRFLGSTPFTAPNSIRSAILAGLMLHSPYVTLCHPISPIFAPFHGGPGPHLTHGTLAHLTNQPKQHPNCLSCCCRMHGDRQPDRMTDRQMDQATQPAARAQLSLYS